MGERHAAGHARAAATCCMRALPTRTAIVPAGERRRTSRRKLAGYLPVVGKMTAIDGKATAYVCENYTCQAAHERIR